ncbi:flagellar biosynthesis protein FlhF [Sulfuriferula sp. AH1]|uniref:flagellar biosynthesis protein FlhF n=1 Tax=Sulfuriferula sp. AH1 TaxID=1985873 RepID=UPI000B3BA068|nr:flagellar biosynthesis protein FlhF [Sulfuriferula sp. AH1]ARU31443.1 flagellar biosynthesis protein FlhF [Sulfuriferula sp. AH1]
MNVQKFIASNSREALRQVRDVLGADAVILSNRNVAGGVEIMALAGDDIASLVSPSVEREAEPKAALMALDTAPRPQKTVSRRNQAEDLANALQTARAPAAIVKTGKPAKPVASQELDEVMNEIRAMRGMLEAQLSEIAWGTMQNREPFRADIMRELLSTGFSASLSRHLTENLPEVKTAEDGMHWVKSVLSRNLNVISNENEILEKGGVFALVGPTGVGKTTTTAKLAARCVMRHGANKLALITTDGYRIGGHEQLRIYGKILGVMVHSVKDESDLRIALEELKGKHTVLIDTVGMNQRDQMVAEQVAMLSGAGAPVKRLLCLNATSTGETLSEVVRAYQGSGLAGCIITKLDEAATMGNVLDVIIRQKLNLYYVANGQRVPEDLHILGREAMIDRAFRLKRDSAAFQFQDDELSLVVANAVRANQDKTLREVNLG